MFERVYTIYDYHDGPRSGVANFDGRPHYYTCEWDESADEYADSFALKLLDEASLSLALEQWAIWREWEAAFYSGQRDQQSHPGLPGQNAVYEELGRSFGAKIDALPVSQRARASFRICSDQESLPQGALRNLEVRWSVLPNQTMERTR